MTQNPSDHPTAPEGPRGEKPKLVDVRESIRYRRRAQEAEQRCEDLQAQLDELQRSRQTDVGGLEEQLAAERRNREQLEQRLSASDTDRRLQHELIRAGARDPETALLVARQRLAEADDAEVDLADLARTVLGEKPYLKQPEREEVPPIGRSAQGERPAGSGGRARAEKLAHAARSSGRPADLAEYMRARRTVHG